jgi:intraflagellar transport protein 22
LPAPKDLVRGNYEIASPKTPSLPLNSINIPHLPFPTGKTIISNFLAGQGGDDALLSSRYDATAGVRILEFDAPGRNSENVNIELWDASGDHSYETCWKAIMVDSDGVILVYNPDKPGQDQQLNDWFEFFVKKNGLKDEQCMILAHRSNQNEASGRFRPRK